MDLDTAALGNGLRLKRCDTIDSTNAEALRLARAGARGPLWVTARRQTAGRGRRGRDWASPPGNLYATLLLTDPAPSPCVAELSFVAGVALADAVAGVAPELAPRLQIKWPNDLLCDSAKLAGILVEGEGVPVAAVVGIGVNCAHHPAGTSYPATDLAAAGASVAPDELIGALDSAMTVRLAQWDRGQNFAAIREAWLARASGLRETLRVTVAERTIEGRFEGLDAIGRLLLRRPDGTVETVTAGEVFPLATVAAAAARAAEAARQ
jgi:BirA family transcriptional regulator, biotin operon repressor / biotin---[acetyl-CoA-carboxylase] ligase